MVPRSLIIFTVLLIASGTRLFSQSLENPKVLSLGSTGDRLYKAGYYTQALSIATHLLDSISLQPEVDSILLAKSLFRVGELENLCGITTGLTEHLENAYKIYYRQVGLKDDTAVRMCCAYGDGLIRVLEWDKAFDLINDTYREVENIPTITRPPKILLRWTLGNICHNQRRYREAEDIYHECIEQWKDEGQTNTSEYTIAQFCLGSLYASQGKFDAGLERYLDALEHCKRTFSEQHMVYGKLLNGLAFTYAVQGDWFEARIHYQNALEIILESMGEMAWYEGIVLQNLGRLYLLLGDAKASRLLLVKAQEIIEHTSGKMHSDYPMILSNIAKTYQFEGQFSEARTLLFESLQIRKDLLGEEHPYYPSCLAQIAINYLAEGKADTAQQYLENALTILYRIDGSANPSTVEPKQLLAHAYERMGYYAIADSINSELGCMIDSMFTQGSMECAINQDLQAKLNLMAGKSHETILASAQRSLETWKNLVSSVAKSASPNELERFLPQLEEHNRLAYSISQYLGDAELALNTSLLVRNLALESHYFLSNSDIQHHSAESIEWHKAWRSVQKSLSFELSKPIKSQSAEYINELTLQARALELKIVQFAPDFIQKDNLVDWKNIARALDAGEAAIEFISYQPISNTSKIQEVQYSAVIVTSQHEPIILPLFTESKLQRLLNKTDNSPEATSKLYAAARSGELLDPVPSYGTELYKLIWHPIDRFLRTEHIKTVYYSPSGLLHRLAFDALPIDKNKVLSSRYELHRVGSIREIKFQPVITVAKTLSASLFGGVQYDYFGPRNEQDGHLKSASHFLWSIVELPRNGTMDRFEFLPGTAVEIERLGQLLKKKGLNVQKYSDTDANEEAINQLGQGLHMSPDVLHIATHGFFFPEPEQQKPVGMKNELAFKWNTNPLFRSGLAMAGANIAWSGNSLPKNSEDGIATAYEISQLNLSNTKLAVLSACETGLGDIKGSEGVYGLQRAFKMAGVDNLLVSLWQVPDRESVEFMELFYRNWLRGKPVHKAFSKAQKKMRRKYKDVYKWGAWILIE